MFGEVKGVTRNGWLSALPCGVLAVGLAGQSAQAGNYYDVVASQTPLLHFGFNETSNPGDTSPISTVVDNLDSLLGAGNFVADANLGIDTGVGVASLEPTSGYDGFDAGNTAFNFNSGNALIMSLTNPLASMGMAGGTVSMWTRSSAPSAANTGGVLYRGDEGGGEVLHLRLVDLPNGNGIFTLELLTDDVPTIYAETDGTTDYSDGDWHHIAATWEYDDVLDSGSLNVYVDGGTLAGGEQDTFVFDSIAFPNIMIGDEIMDFDFRHRIGKGRINAHSYVGDMDEPVLWNRALTAEEIEAQYDAAFSVGSLVGDLDLDGFVGITDLNLVLSSWNATVTDGDPADPSGDLFVGIEDLNVVLGNWNAGTPPPAAVVPEPATLALLSLGGLAVLRRSQR